jgi:hypothetical protein
MQTLINFAEAKRSELARQRQYSKLKKIRIYNHLNNTRWQPLKIRSKCFSSRRIVSMDLKRRGLSGEDTEELHLSKMTLASE